MKKRALTYWISLAVGIVLFVGVAAIRNLLSLTDEAEILSALCDAFFVPGALLVCAGLLSLSAKEGVFDMLFYGCKSLLVLFSPLRKPEKHQRYWDYKQMKEASREKFQPGILMVGLGFILVAGICLYFYYQVIG